MGIFKGGFSGFKLPHVEMSCKRLKCVKYAQNHYKPPHPKKYFLFWLCSRFNVNSLNVVVYRNSA